jgi:TIR domain
MATTLPAIFISYRTFDGADKATALARDLGRRFGPQSVFLDKDDLSAGSRWRAVIARQIGSRPVVLALLTPQYIGARDDSGSRRIDHADDPVRSEFAAAVAAGAHIVPLLCDGVEALPPGDTLPPELKTMAELTWRRLRTYDWDHDVARLLDDLRALGLKDAAAAEPDKRRWAIALAAAAAALAAVAGVAGFKALTGRRNNDISGAWSAAFDMPEKPAAAAATPASSSSRNSQIAKLRPPLRLRMKPTDAGFAAASAPVVVADDPGWASFNENWRRITHTEPPRMIYRFEGSLRDDVPGEPPVFEAELKVVPESGGQAIDSGGFRGHLVDDGKRIQGWIWINSEQAERGMTWQRDDA